MALWPIFCVARSLRIDLDTLVPANRPNRRRRTPPTMRRCTKALPDRLTFRPICGFSLHLTMHCQEIGERAAQTSSA